MKKAKKKRKNEKVVTYGKGKRSAVFMYTVTLIDSHGAKKSEKVVKVTVKGSNEFNLEKNKDEFCAKVEREFAKKKNKEMSFLHEERVAL